MTNGQKLQSCLSVTNNDFPFIFDHTKNIEHKQIERERKQWQLQPTAL